MARLPAATPRNPLAELAALTQQLASAPHDPAPWCRIGLVYLGLGELDEAEASFVTARQLDPNHAEARFGLAIVRHTQGNSAAALELIDQTIAIQPQDQRYWSARAHLLACSGAPAEQVFAAYTDWGRRFADPLRAGADAAQAFAAAPATSASDHMEQAWRDIPSSAGGSPAMFVREALIYSNRGLRRSYKNQALVGAAQAAIGKSPFDQRFVRSTERRKLRVAYVSADLREHALAYFIEPVLRQHDRQRFELHAFASAPADTTTARLRPLFDHWHDLSGVSDAVAAERIAAAGIDIAVDLSGHTDGTRLLSLARRPAPIIFTWFGYNCTTGMRHLTGRLTDAVMDPPGNDAYASEPLQRLPVFACYQPPAGLPPVGPLPMLQRGSITFGSLNNAQKLSNATLQCWGKLLRRVPGSRLLLIGAHGPTAAGAAQPLRTRLQQAGLPLERVELLPRQHRSAYFRLGQRIDIALEPWPFSGGVTTCHALWMGLPCITLAGTMPYERAAAAILHAAGLDDLIADSPEEYLSRATRLACDVVHLETLRHGLRPQLQASPLMDYRTQAMALETIFEQAHEDLVQAKASA